MATLHKVPLDKINSNSDTFLDWFNEYNSTIDFLNDNRDLEPFSDGTNLTIKLNAGWVHLPDGAKYFDEQSIDLTSYLPITNSKYVLIGVDTLGEIIVREGIEATNPQYPNGTGLAGICFVLLSPSTTIVDDTNITDIRSIIGFSGTGGNSTEIFKYYQLLQTEPYNKLFFDIFANEYYILSGSLTGTYNLQDSKIILNNGEYFTTTNLMQTPISYFKVVIDALYSDKIKLEYSIDNRQTFTEISTETTENIFVNDNLYLRFTSLVDSNELYSYALLYDFTGITYYAKGKLYEVYTAQSNLPGGTNLTIPNNKHYTNNGVSLIIHDSNGIRWIEGQDYNEINDTTIQLITPLNANEKLIFEEYYSTIEDETTLTIEDHNSNPDAHLDIQNAIEEAGIFVENSTDYANFKYIGQYWNKNVAFDSTVNNGDVVYKKSDGKYYKAIADGTNASNVIGIADVTNSKVMVSGIIQINYTFDINDNIYVSSTNAGILTKDKSRIKLGTMIADNLLLLRPEFQGIYKHISSNYFTLGEKIIGVDSSSAAITITLSSADVFKGSEIFIKDEMGNAGTNNITIATENSETIDENTSIVLNTNFGKLHLYSDGVNWFEI